MTILANAVSGRKKFKELSTVTGYTEASTLPMSLMFGQPNNVQYLNYKMESISELSASMGDILSDRIKVLDFTLRETISSTKAFFNLDSRLSYEIAAVPYSRLAGVRLQNIIGLKANMFDYAKKLDKALDLAVNILEFELQGLTKLVAQLLAEKDSLTSIRPISAIADLKMYSTDVDKEKVELAAMIGHDAHQQYVEFGSIYFSLGEWKECTRLVTTMSLRLKKLKLERFAKDIKNLTALMDKLIIKMDGVDIPKTNIEQYATLIEQSSNNVAFAGATIHMCQTLVQTFNNHNEVLRIEIDDYKKHNK